MPYPAPWDRSFISVFSILLLEASYSVPNLLNKSKKDHIKFAYGQKKLNDLSEKVDSFIKNVQVVFIYPVFGSLIGFSKTTTFRALRAPIFYRLWRQNPSHPLCGWLLTQAFEKGGFNDGFQAMENS